VRPLRRPTRRKDKLQRAWGYVDLSQGRAPLFAACHSIVIERDHIRRDSATLVRKVIDLGGDTEKMDADFNQFEESETPNRIEITVKPRIRIGEAELVGLTARRSG
jgi:hypothetical protein